MLVICVLQFWKLTNLLSVHWKFYSYFFVLKSILEPAWPCPWTCVARSWRLPRPRPTCVARSGGVLVALARPCTWTCVAKSWSLRRLRPSPGVFLALAQVLESSSPILEADEDVAPQACDHPWSSRSCVLPGSGVALALAFPGQSTTLKQGAYAYNKHIRNWFIAFFTYRTLYFI